VGTRVLREGRRGRRPPAGDLLLLVLERHRGLGLAVGAGDDDGDGALVVIALGGHRASGRDAVAGHGVLLDLEARGLELALVPVRHLVDAVLGRDSESRRAALRAVGVKGALDGTARIDRHPRGEVVRAAGRPEGGDLLLAFLIGRLDHGALAARGVDRRGPLVGLDAELAVFGVLGAEGHDLAGLLVLHREGAGLGVRAHQLEIRIGPHDHLGRGHGRIFLELVNLLLDDETHYAHGDDAEEDDHRAPDPHHGEWAHPLLGRRRRLCRNIHGNSPWSLLLWLKIVSSLRRYHCAATRVSAAQSTQAPQPSLLLPARTGMATLKAAELR
jgi:hypothetical protein